MNAHEIEVSTHGSTKPGIVFANAPGKYQQIESAQNGSEGGYSLGYGCGENFNGEPAPGVATLRQVLQFSHVCRAFGQCGEAGVTIQQGLKLFCVHLLVAQQVQDNPRIKIAAARAHGDASSR